MTRNEMIETINAKAKGFLREEIDYSMSLDRDYEYDELDALFDTECRAEDFKERGLLLSCRRLLITIGFYRVMPQNEIDNTWVSSGTKWDFKLGGVAYTADESRYVFEEKLKAAA